MPPPSITSVFAARIRLRPPIAAAASLIVCCSAVGCAQALIARASSGSQEDRCIMSRSAPERSQSRRSYTERMKILAPLLVLFFIQPPPSVVDTPTVKVLTGLTVPEFEAEMQLMTQALGASCGTCHARGNFASDDNPRKARARRDARDDQGDQPAVFPGSPTARRGIEAWAYHLLHVSPGRSASEISSAALSKTPTSARPFCQAQTVHVLSASRREGGIG